MKKGVWENKLKKGTGKEELILFIRIDPYDIVDRTDSSF